MARYIYTIDNLFDSEYSQNNIKACECLAIYKRLVKELKALNNYRILKKINILEIKSCKYKNHKHCNAKCQYACSNVYNKHYKKLTQNAAGGGCCSPWFDFKTLNNSKAPNLNTMYDVFVAAYGDFLKENNQHPNADGMFTHIVDSIPLTMILIKSSKIAPIPRANTN